VPLQRYTNGLATSETDGAATIALPAGSGWSAMRIDVIAFTRGPV
jgi:hypothetical protein